MPVTGEVDCRGSAPVAVSETAGTDYRITQPPERTQQAIAGYAARQLHAASKGINSSLT